MNERELVKVKRGNALSNLWDEIFKKKIQMLYRPLVPNYGPVEQRFSPDRQRKKAVMREQGITGKQYRAQLKRQRRTPNGIDCTQKEDG